MHLTGVVNGTSIKLYINGIENASAVSDGTIKTTTKDVTIGKLRQEDSIYTFKGLIDDVRIYNTALSATDILKLQAPQVDWQSGTTNFTAANNITLAGSINTGASDLSLTASGGALSEWLAH